MSTEIIILNPDIKRRLTGERKHTLDPATKRRVNNVIKKPWKTCTWYPDQCDAVGCDCGQGPCEIYKDDSDTWNDVLVF